MKTLNRKSNLQGKKANDTLVGRNYKVPTKLDNQSNKNQLYTPLLVQNTDGNIRNKRNLEIKCYKRILNGGCLHLDISQLQHCQ